jgi:hypothetical protein
MTDELLFSYLPCGLMACYTLLRGWCLLCITPTLLLQVSGSRCRQQCEPPSDRVHLHQWERQRCPRQEPQLPDFLWWDGSSPQPYAGSAQPQPAGPPAASTGPVRTPVHPRTGPPAGAHTGNAVVGTSWRGLSVLLPPAGRIGRRAGVCEVCDGFVRGLSCLRRGCGQRSVWSAPDSYGR